jgi:hypothetical protein
MVRSPTVDGGAVAPASLYRPDNATTGTPVWLTPNSTNNDHNPSINCKIPATNQLSEAAYCDMVKLQGIWPSRGRRPTPMRLSRPAVRQVCTAASLWSHPWWRSFHPEALSGHQMARIASPARIQAWGSPSARCTAPVISFSSLYHQKPYQDAWQSGLQCPDLQFSCDNLLIHL